MALIHLDGFDSQDTTIAYSLIPNLTASNITYTSSTVYGSGYAMNMTLGNTGSIAKPVPGTAQIFMGARLLCPGINASQNFFTLLGDNGSTTHLQFRRTANDCISVYRSGTLLGTSTTGVFDANWHYVEVSATISDTVGTAVVRVDGTQVLSLSNVDTKNAGTNSTIDQVQLGIASGAPLTVDDWYICDATGSAPYNTFLGDVRVQPLVGNGAGTNTQLTPSVAPNWDCTNELPYSATDYVSGSTVGQKDTYAMTDLAAGYTILGVKTKAIAKKTDAGTRNLKTVLRSGGTDYTDPSATALSGTDSPVWYIRTADPATSAAWTTTGINAMEVGVEVN